MCALEWNLTQEKLQRAVEELSKIAAIGPFDVEKVAALAKDVVRYASLLAGDAPSGATRPNPTEPTAWGEK
jgi:hypothetical protein